MKKTIKTKLNKKIKALRALLGLTQKAFSKVVGVSRVRIAEWEGGRGAPNSERMRLLINLGKKHKFEFTTDDILEIGRGAQKKKA